MYASPPPNHPTKLSPIIVFFHPRGLRLAAHAVPVPVLWAAGTTRVWPRRWSTRTPGPTPSASPASSSPGSPPAPLIPSRRHIPLTPLPHSPSRDPGGSPALSPVISDHQCYLTKLLFHSFFPKKCCFFVTLFSTKVVKKEKIARLFVGGKKIPACFFNPQTSFLYKKVVFFTITARDTSMASFFRPRLPVDCFRRHRFDSIAPPFSGASDRCIDPGPNAPLLDIQCTGRATCTPHNGLPLERPVRWGPWQAPPHSSLVLVSAPPPNSQCHALPQSPNASLGTRGRGQGRGRVPGPEKAVKVEFRRPPPLPPPNILNLSSVGVGQPFPPATDPMATSDLTGFSG